MVEPLTPSNRSAIQRVLLNTDLQPLLFKEAKGLKWFDAFYKEGFFDVEKNPAPNQEDEGRSISVPIWPITNYLVATSEDLKIKENEEYAIKVLNLMRHVTQYSITQGVSNYRTWWQFARVIKSIPSQLIDIRDTKMIDYWLNDPYDRVLVADEVGRKWLPKLLMESNNHSKEISQNLLNAIYRIDFKDRVGVSLKGKDPIFRYDTWYVNEITKDVASLSGLKLGLPPVYLFEHQLVSILEELDNDTYSYIWRPAIEDHEQNHGRDVSDVIVSAYRDCVAGLVNNDEAVAIEQIKSMLGSKYDTLKRIAIYIVNHKYNHLKELVDAVLILDYFKANLRHEMWHFLNNRYGSFSNLQKRRVLDLIQSLEVTDSNNVVNEKATTYRRSEWLSSIKDMDKKAARMYVKYTGEIDKKVDHPDFSSYMTFKWGSQNSPIPIERLLLLSTDELVQTINNYVKKYEYSTSFEDDGIEGLVEAFKTLIKKKADDIYKEVLKFINCDLGFIYPIIGTYRELWNEKKELSWSDIWPRILEFCALVIKKYGFWSETAAKGRREVIANSGWVVSDIAHLIEDGVKIDEHAFDPVLIPIARDLLLTMLNEQKSEEFGHDRDAISTTINSPRGRCLEALINLTLRECRLADQNNNRDHSKVWIEYAPIFEAEIDRVPSYEIATLMAMYLPNFLYISREWTLSHLDTIFDQSNYQRWLCAMQGYAYVTTMYREIYTHLKMKGDFHKALDDENLKGRLEDRIIQYIAVAYINDDDKIEETDSMMLKLLERKDTNELKAIIWFIWTLRKELNRKKKIKVFELWPKLLDTLDLETKEGKIIASQLCRWSVFVNTIDDNTRDLLLRIAPYAQEDHNTTELLNSLSRISDKQPLEAQKLWHEMMSVPSYDYPDDAIKNILKNLVALGPQGKRKAREITSVYLEYGSDRPMLWLDEIENS